MEIKELFEKGILEVQEAIKKATLEKKKIIKEIKNLRAELRRKERAKSIYFGEKIKPKKIIEKQEVHYDKG